MLTDLGGVTRTLKKLFEAGLRLQNVSDTLFSITAAPPDQTFSRPATVSVYLYHVLESPETKNLPPSSVGTSPVPISLSPLGLILQYIVTVVTPNNDEQYLDGQALLQQQYLGYITRILHDNPAITKKTRITVPGSTIPLDILDPELAKTNSVIQLVMRPAPKEEIVSFWNSQENHVPRLSLFVEARVAVLEAQPPPVVPGLVLSIGQFIFPSNSPQLLATRNDIWLQPPPGFGNPRKIEASPARVALFDTPGSTDLTAFTAPVPTTPPDLRSNFLNNNHLTIDGVGLTQGRRLLLLRRGDSSISIDLDQPRAAQPAINRDWELKATADSVSLRVFRQVFDSKTNSAVELLPGSYAARVVVMDPRAGDRPQPRSSNEVSFTLTPQIVSVAPATPHVAATYVLRLVGAYLDASLDILLAIGGVALRKTDHDGPTAGEFFVPPPSSPPSPPSAVNQITFVLRTTDPETGAPISPPSPSNPVPVQLVVNGATATPAWIIEEATDL